MKTDYFQFLDEANMRRVYIAVQTECRLHKIEKMMPDFSANVPEFTQLFKFIKEHFAKTFIYKAFWTGTNEDFNKFWDKLPE